MEFYTAYPGKFVQSFVRCSNSVIIVADHYPGGEMFIRMKTKVTFSDVVVFSDFIDASLDTLLLIRELSTRKPSRLFGVIPYMPYSRQDRRQSESDCLFSEHLANLIIDSGVTHVLLVEPHDKKTRSYFESRQVNYIEVPALEYLVTRVVNQLGKDVVLVAPDKGSYDSVNKIASVLGMESTYIPKTRGAEGVVIRETVDELPVKGKTVLLVDDMIDTARTLVSAAEVVFANGAGDVYVCAVHGLFSGDAIERIRSANISGVTVANTIEEVGHVAEENPELVSVVDITPLLNSVIGSA